MKINLLLGFIFIAMIIVASENSVDNQDLIGCTELTGSGCVCHALERDFNVEVWVEGPDTLNAGEMGLYKMFLAGGPAEAGGYNVAGRFGEMVLVDTFSFQHPMAMNELTQAFSLPFPSPQDTIYWEFGYLASDSSFTDTIYSCGLSIVWDLIPDTLDRWNFGPKFPITILGVAPVESEQNSIPEDFLLTQNYPNPFNPNTTIKYQIPKLSFVTLKVFDVLGNELVTLVNEEKPAGNYEVEFNSHSSEVRSAAGGLPSGIYFYRLQAGELIQTKKMLLLK